MQSRIEQHGLTGSLRPQQCGYLKAQHRSERVGFLQSYRHPGQSWFKQANRAFNRMANAFLLDGIPEVVWSKVGHTESEHRVRRLFVVRVKITFCAAGVQKRCQI